MFETILYDSRTDEELRRSPWKFKDYKDAECWGKEECNMFPNEIYYVVVDENGKEV